MKILCLLVRFGENHHPEARQELAAWYERHGAGLDVTFWVLDNSLSPDSIPRHEDGRTWIRAGDNRAWEFSAWARALHEAESEGVAYDVVHFVTSSFNTLYTGYLDHFSPPMLEMVLQKGIGLGHIDGHPKGFRLQDREFKSWIRTCFFFLARSTARSVTEWAHFRATDRFFSHADAATFRPDAPLSPAYREHLAAWLTGAEIGGHRWHSPVGAGEAEIRRFQSKVLAIINEHRLSLHLREIGVPLVDFCWLHLQGVAANSDTPRIVAENEQLVVRRRHLGIPEPGSEGA
ncbi:MAG TPA: hypothetical protein VGM73_11745 [Candidatus Didemnitutus sp.]|jgi:hypothetical protein